MKGKIIKQKKLNRDKIPFERKKLNQPIPKKDIKNVKQDTK